jgi:hypothetical protein
MMEVNGSLTILILCKALFAQELLFRIEPVGRRPAPDDSTPISTGWHRSQYLQVVERSIFSARRS